MNRKRLLDLGSDSDGESGGNQLLTVNKNYAERYDKWRGSEELQKLKDRYGDIPLNHADDESSSSSSEEEWTADKEKEFFKTFSLLKKKDPKIYDSNIRFFGDTEQKAPESSTTKSKKKEKAFSIKDHERKMLLEKGGLSDDEDDDQVPKIIQPSYVEEQASIKKGFSEALNQIDSDDDGDDMIKSDLLKKRKKTDAEKEGEEEEYRKWLKGEVAKVKDESGIDELKFLREYWTDPKLNEDEKFLRDYILKRKYRESDDKNYVPTYDEIVHDSDEEGLSGDEANVQKMEDFEHKYNFRFEEPDQEFIKRYPRTVESSLRRADDKRKKQRDAAKERKEAEKAKKREEIQRLKALKRQEIMDKIKQLEDITGDAGLATKIEDHDIEGDFDPDEHDKRMKKLFSEDYYGEGEEEKPVFPYDEELDEEWKAYCPDEESNDEDGEEDAGTQVSTKTRPKASTVAVEDHSDEPSTSKSKGFIDELIENSKGKSKKKKKSVFMEALERAKPKFDPSNYESFDQYFDEYYKLDFEDLIGDLPCRFKYRKVMPNDFGLTVNEILEAPDNELNQWASLKKTFQYRTPEEEKYDLQAYQKKSENVRQKQKVLPSLFKTEEEEGEEEAEPCTNQSDQNGHENKKKKKKNKKKKKKKPQAPTELEEPAPETLPEPEPETLPDHEPALLPDTPSSESKKKKKNKKRKSDNEHADTSALQPQESLEVEEPVKKKKKKEVASVTTEESFTNGTSDSTTNSSTPKKKKNKKNKSSLNSSAPEAQNVTNGNPESKKNAGKKRKFQQNDPEPQHKKPHKDFNNKNASKSPALPVADDRLRAYGINPTKFKKQLKYGNKK